MTSNFRILIAGCGSAGSRHARNLSSLGVKDVYLFDPDTERAKRLASEIGATQVESLEPALETGMDAVVVATPPGDHIATAELAIDAGSHLLIEKPLSISIEKVNEVLAKAEKSNLTVMAAYNLRYLPALVTIKQMITSGELGRVMAVHAEFGQYLPTWRPNTDYRNNYITSGDSGGGIILEESHEFDYVMWLAGPVSTVYCAAGKLSELEMDAEDTAFVTMRHIGKTISTIRIDCTQHGYRRGIRVVGTEATVDWDFSRGIEVTGRGGEKRLDNFASDVTQTYIEEMKTFLACLAGEAAPDVDGRGALKVLEATLAAKESARTGKEIAL